MSNDKLALYFGCLGEIGHYLHDRKTRWVNPEEYGCPWDIGLMDSGLLNNRKVPDVPDGRVHWVAGGRPLWHAFIWWDRSVDGRGACNSGFYVRGFHPEHVSRQSVEPLIPKAFQFACGQWPEVVARQRFPLVLEPPPWPESPP